MRDRVPCEFFLLRYVPDVVKGEFVNIGVLLRESGLSRLPRAYASPATGAAFAASTLPPTLLCSKTFEAGAHPRLVLNLAKPRPEQPSGRTFCSTPCRIRFSNSLQISEPQRLARRKPRH